MKHLIMWGSLIILCVILALLWNKITIISLFSEKTSPLYVDIILFLLGLQLAVIRLIAIIRKL